MIMTKTLRHWFGKRPGRRRRMLILVCATTGALALTLIIVRGESGHEVPIADMPVVFLQEQPTFSPKQSQTFMSTPTQQPVLSLLSASVDGKWLCLAELPARYSSQSNNATRLVLFDVEQRRFVAALKPSSSMWFGSSYLRFLTPLVWSPQFVPMVLTTREQTVFEKVFSRFAGWFGRRATPSYRKMFHAVDLTARRARFLSEETGFFPTDISFNTDFTAVGCGFGRRGRDGNFEYQFVVRDLRSGRRRALDCSPCRSRPENALALAGWVGDSRVLALQEGHTVEQSFGPGRNRYCLDNLYLFDTRRGRKPRKIPVGPAFEKLPAEHAVPPTGARRYERGVLSIRGPELTVRLIEAFTTGGVRFEPKDRRVWDLNVDTGRLSLVLNLPGSVRRVSSLPHGGWRYAPSVFSPSASASVTRSASGRASYKGIVRSHRLLLHTAGDSPRTLPVDLPDYTYPASPGGIYALAEQLQFLDENTLVYIDKDIQLWKFSLQTWKSELLWTPEKPQGDGD